MKHYSLLRASAMFFISVAVTPVSSGVVDDYAVGREGAALKRTLREHCAPSTVIDIGSMPWKDYFDILTVMQRDAAGVAVVDAVTGRAYTMADTRMSLTSCNMIDRSWFGSPSDYKRLSACDLYNSILTCADVMQARSSGEGFASVDGASEVGTASGWSKGMLHLDGWEMPVVEPADEMKGMIARRMFYMSAIYPCTIWCADGEKFFDGAEYPGLSDFSSGIYLSWHRSWPVTDSERRCNDEVERLQGNRNPFVDYPDLVEYLWGEHAGEAYPGADMPGGDDDPSADVRIPLRGIYSLSDKWIDLYSPYIPEDASWSIDGHSVTELRVSPVSLGAGMHELKYRSAASSGKLKINIVP